MKLSQIMTSVKILMFIVTPWARKREKERQIKVKYIHKQPITLHY